MKKILYKIKRTLSLDGFSIAPVYTQITLLILLSLSIISVFAFYYGSFSSSYFTFMDPTSIPEENIIIVLIEALTGLIIASFVISILSSSLENFIEKIKKGTLAFKKSNHIVFFNVNEKIFQILSELNDKFLELEEIQEIVIILKTPDEVEEFMDDINFNEYHWLSIFIKFGNHLEEETYLKFNLENARSITILKNGDDFSADNEQLKIYTSLLSTNIDFNTINLTVEGNSTCNIINIYNGLKTFENFYNIAYIDTKKFLAKLLNRTLIDVTYYKIYEEIFSFDGYEIYIRLAEKLNINNELYKDIALKLDDALLIGIKRDGKMILNKPNEIILESDELILIAKNENEIALKSKNIEIIPIHIEEPSEIVYKKICTIGKTINTDELLEFLDDKAKKDFKKINFSNFEEYLSSDFLIELKKENYDVVIINLSEEETIRYILYMVTFFGKDNSFIKSIVSIVSNPENAKIIEKITGNNNVILSQRISAKFIAQLCFETELIDIINELVSAIGNEFNIIENKFQDTSLDQLKIQLLENNMSFIGLKNGDEIDINGKNLKEATHIIVLSEGSV